MAKGYVLCGVPANGAQARALVELVGLPDIAFEATGDSSTARVRAARVAQRCADDGMPSELHRPITDGHYADAERAAADATEVLRAANPHVVKAVNWDRAAWPVAEEVVTRVRARTLAKMRLKAAAASPHAPAAAVGDVGLSIAAVRGGLGRFADYCPVTWARARRLRRGGDGRQDGGLAFAAVHNGAFYILAGARELCAFIADAGRFLRTHRLPEVLPTAVAEAEAGAGDACLALQGFCPVTYAQAPRGLSYERRVKVRLRCPPCPRAQASPAAPRGRCLRPW